MVISVQKDFIDSSVVITVIQALHYNLLYIYSVLTALVPVIFV